MEDRRYEGTTANPFVYADNKQAYTVFSIGKGQFVLKTSGGASISESSGSPAYLLKSLGRNAPVPLQLFFRSHMQRHDTIFRLDALAHGLAVLNQAESFTALDGVQESQSGDSSFRIQYVPGVRDSISVHTAQGSLHYIMNSKGGRVFSHGDVSQTVGAAERELDILGTRMYLDALIEEI